MRMIVVAALVTAGGACTSDEPPVAPERPTVDPESAVAASVSATALPPWFSAYVNALPAEAKPVWGNCKLAGTMKPNGSPLTIGTNCRLMLVDGFPRRYVVYVPNHPNVIAGSDVPLVVMYHGSGQNGEHFYNESGWRQEADSNGFIVVFPSGINYQLTTGAISTKWNSYGLLADINVAWKPAGYPPVAPWPADDVKYTRQLLDDLIAQTDIDTARMHVSGFSNGGGMATRLAIEVGDRLASAAVISNAAPSPYTPIERIPMFFAVGNRDVNVIAAINSALLPNQAAVTTVPLAPANLFSYADPVLRRNASTTTFGLVSNAFTTTTNATWTLMRWTTPAPGNLAGNDLWWGIIRGVDHEYPRGPGRLLPNGVPIAANNPLGFDAPRTFYSFFRTHPK